VCPITEGKVNYRESRDTSNIGYTIHRRTTIKAKEQHSKQKGKSIIDNPEIQATLGTRRNEGISGLFIIDCPFCLLCCSFVFIVVLLCVVFPMLPVSLDCLLLTVPSVCCVVPLFSNKNTIHKTEVAINNKQSRDTGNIGQTRYRRTTIKAKEQHSKQKGKSIIENPEIQATMGTRRNEDKQNKNTIQKTEVAINNKKSSDTSNVLCPMLTVSLDSLLLTFPSVCCVVPLL
jgi:hypothetical protein